MHPSPMQQEDEAPHKCFNVLAVECMTIKGNLDYRNFQLQPFHAHAIVRVMPIRRSIFNYFLFFSFFLSYFLSSSWEKIHPFVGYLAMNNNDSLMSMVETLVIMLQGYRVAFG